MNHLEDIVWMTKANIHLITSIGYLEKSICNCSGETICSRCNYLQSLKEVNNSLNEDLFNEK